MMRLCVHGLALAEAALLLAVLWTHVFGPDTAPSSDGPEWSGLLLVLLPPAVLLGAAAMFHFARPCWLRGIAAAVVAAPLLALAWQAVDAS